MELLTVTINGRRLQVPAGTNILQAAEAHGIHIPTLCYEEGLTATGACRLCVVEIKGARKLAAACTTPVAEGMEIYTESERVVAARREVLRLLLANHDLRCLTCERNGDCRLQDYCYRYKVEDTPYEGVLREYPIDSDNPFFIRDYSKCIRCGKCVLICAEVNGAHVYDFMERGIDTKVTSAYDDNLQETTCTACGMCVNVCPVGALVEKSTLWKGRAWEIEKVTTTCPYCGVGCQLKLKVKDGRIIGVAADKSGSNRGHLCAKGQFGWDFVHSPDRLTRPLVRKNGRLVETSWEEALALTAARFRTILHRYGGKAIAGLSSAKATNEENYLFQKFMRAVLKTNNVDHCARLCHSSTVAGLATAFGSGAMTGSLDDLLAAEVIFLIGANTTEAHPVTGYRIKQAVRRGTKLIVADPRRIELVKYADVWLRHRPGTDIALLNGLAHVILQENLWDKEFVATHSEGFDEWRRVVEKYPPERVAQICEVEADTIVRAARLFGRARRGCIVYAMGITQHRSGTQNVMAVANLAILTGNVGREGTGVFPLRGQNNVQGACDMGALPNYYPSYQPVEDADVRRRFQEFWGTELPAEPGLTVTEMMTAAAAGKIKAMYIMGENPVLSDPDAAHVEEVLKNLEFLVVQDIFLTETARLADVVFPAASFAEKDGTFTNTERRIQRVRKAVLPPGEAKADWETIVALAREMGYPWKYPRGPEEIMSEIARCTPLYGGINYSRLEEGGIQWPCPTSDHPGTPRLHAQGFSRGKGKFHPVEHIPAAEEPDRNYPLILTTGRNLHQFHTGSMSRRSRLHQLRPYELMMIHPQDAAARGIKDGDTVAVASRRGEVVTRVQVTDDVPPGTVFMTFHYPEVPTNVLTSPATDPICKIPELKVTAVQVSKAP